MCLALDDRFHTTKFDAIRITENDCTDLEHTSLMAPVKVDITYQLFSLKINVDTIIAQVIYIECHVIGLFLARKETGAGCLVSEISHYILVEKHQDLVSDNCGVLSSPDL